MLTNAAIRWELLLLFGDSEPICHQICHPCFRVDADFFVNRSPCSQAQSSTDSSAEGTSEQRDSVVLSGYREFNATFIHS